MSKRQKAKSRLLNTFAFLHGCQTLEDGIERAIFEVWRGCQDLVVESDWIHQLQVPGACKLCGVCDM